RTAEQVTFLSREITKGRERKRVAIVDDPRQFARIVGRADLAFDWGTERLSKIVVRTPLRVESREEGQTVLDDRTANVNTSIDIGVASWSNTGQREVLGARNHVLVSNISKDIAVEFVTTGFGDDVKHAARRQSLVCTIGTRLDLDFLNKLERKIST